MTSAVRKTLGRIAAIVAMCIGLYFALLYGEVP
jgi:hypothetical protein